MDVLDTEKNHPIHALMGPMIQWWAQSKMIQLGALDVVLKLLQWGNLRADTGRSGDTGDLQEDVPWCFRQSTMDVGKTNRQRKLYDKLCVS